MTKESSGWSSLPKGWTQKSIKKFVENLTGKSKTPFTKCVERMKGKMDNPEAFCASTLDQYHGHTMWRGKKKKSAKKVADRWLNR